MDRRILDVEVHREPSGYWVQIPELEGCFASGKTLDELILALREAIAMSAPGPDPYAAVATDNDDDSQPQPLLTRVVGLRIEVQLDLRTAHADDVTQPPRRPRRQAHREDWPPR